ncbi:MAG: ABC transporter ATP-binding protein [Xanthomonadales bacterium]|nr:ABC transporter ATP-binding protein [Xanthomonadales bacterium]MCE7931936.1 ABC transporter ATP-binding protein [Xanthomonadales bacterium PRO6]
MIVATAALDIHGLRKCFGAQTVLDYLDWEVPAGRVIGLLGRNGAGKSTLIRCALGLSPVDGGEVRLFGEAVATLRPETLHRVGYVPQSFDLFPWMRVRQYLGFHAAFYARWNRELVDGLLGRWEVDAAKKIGELSQGQRQKLAIIRAIAPDPDLLLLDEPVASLDPQTRRLFLAELLRITRRPGKTVVFSTHITTDLERADAEIALLKAGRIQFSADLPTLKARVRRIDLSGPLPDPGFRHPGILRHARDEGQAHWIVDGLDDAAITELAARSGSVWQASAMSLEDIFIELG